MSFLPITSSKSLGDASPAFFFLVLERKAYASFLSYFWTVPKDCHVKNFKIIEKDTPDGVFFEWQSLGTVNKLTEQHVVLYIHACAHPGHDPKYGFSSAGKKTQPCLSRAGGSDAVIGKPDKKDAEIL